MLIYAQSLVRSDPQSNRSWNLAWMVLESDLKCGATLSQTTNKSRSIHISFDLWTSPNRLAFIAIFAHFLDREYRQQNRLIGFRRQLSTHAGENIGAKDQSSGVRAEESQISFHFWLLRAYSTSTSISQIHTPPALRSVRAIFFYSTSNV